MAKELSKKEIKEQKKKNKDKKSFGKDFKSELKKVVWPKPTELLKSTVAVIAIVILISVIVFCLDFAFEAMNKYGIDKLKNSVQTTQEQNNADEETENNNEENAEIEDNSDQTQESDAQTNDAVVDQAGNTEATSENNVQE